MADSSIALERVTDKEQVEQGRKIAFVPWSREECPDAARSEKDWERARRGKGKDKIEFYFEGDAIRDMGGVSQIYVLGHGQANYESLGPRHGSKDVALDATEIARRLIAAGLPKGWRGRIKLYSCNSAAGDHSFAQRFADTLATNEYAGAEVFGYGGRVRRTYSSDGHKHASTNSAFIDFLTCCCSTKPNAEEVRTQIPGRVKESLRLV
jgi:hypothetical protein